MKHKIDSDDRFTEEIIQRCLYFERDETFFGYATFLLLMKKRNIIEVVLKIDFKRVENQVK
jgi:hypothetical protein